MPKQGLAGMFRYGRLCGAVEGTVAACRIPMALIEPATWKRHLRLSSSKEDCRARAIQLVPSAASELQRAKTIIEQKRSCSASTGSREGRRMSKSNLCRCCGQPLPPQAREGAYLLAEVADLRRDREAPWHLDRRPHRDRLRR